MLAFKALVTSQLQWRNAEIRFCSVSQSGFEPSLSGFVPAPTGKKFWGAAECFAAKLPASHRFLKK
jgi:hypothetical protein